MYVSNDFFTCILSSETCLRLELPHVKAWTSWLLRNVIQYELKALEIANIDIRTQREREREGGGLDIHERRGLLKIQCFERQVRKEKMENVNVFKKASWEDNAKERLKKGCDRKHLFVFSTAFLI